MDTSKAFDWNIYSLQKKHPALSVSGTILRGEDSNRQDRMLVPLDLTS